MGMCTVCNMEVADDQMEAHAATHEGTEPAAAPEAPVMPAEEAAPEAPAEEAPAE